VRLLAPQANIWFDEIYTRMESTLDHY